MRQIVRCELPEALNWRRRCARIAGLTIVAGLPACSDAPTQIPTDDILDLIELPALVATDVTSASAGADVGADQVSYISMPPGTLSGIVSAQVTNLTTGKLVARDIVVTEGGFDPVAVAASVGDDLEIEFTRDDGSVVRTRMKVPPRRPPLLVRVSPPEGRPDVVLSARPILVFTEPLDPATVQPSTVRLIDETGPVAGKVGLREGEPWVVEFVPDVALQPETVHVLMVTTALRDQQGDALETPVSVTFKTAPEPVNGPIAFVSTRGGQPAIYVAPMDGSSVRYVTIGDAPAWSPDGDRVAFHRTRSRPGQPAGIYVIDVDGTGETWLAPGRNPTWSRDDVIAWEDAGGIWMISLNGAGVPQTLISNDILFPRHERWEPEDYGPGENTFPTWSPDGRTLAFIRFDPYNWDWGGFRTIYVIDADGTDLRRIDVVCRIPPPGSGYFLCPAWAPTWSPDGSRIGFTTFDFDSTTGGYHRVLASASADGSGGHAVHYRSASISPGSNGALLFPDHPVWSEDDRHMIFDGDREVGGPRRIFILDFESGAVRQLIPDVDLSNYSDSGAVWWQSMLSPWDYEPTGPR